MGHKRLQTSRPVDENGERIGIRIPAGGSDNREERHMKCPGCSSGSTVMEAFESDEHYTVSVYSCPNPTCDIPVFKVWEGDV